ncbi:MAG: AMP-binding protein [Burkholderiaceae bacterium]|nr:AMP-binding protein [Burkholderiaceae bacterium]
MAASPEITSDDLPLQRFCRWERERADRVYLVQPLGGGAVSEITWGQAGDQVRRMAAWMIAQGWPPGSSVAILGKNSAHWILADMAIWMAGHVSVPIYPTFNAQALRYILEHSEAKACFVGKLDDASSLQTGVPAGLPLIALPLAPAVAGALAWTSLIAANQPLQGTPARGADELCTLIYTSGTTGNPKGVMHRFGALAWSLKTAVRRLKMSGEDRFISYLPLAHVAERMVVEQASIFFGSQIFFAESLDTFVQDLHRARPTVFFSVPRLWVKFQQGVSAKMPPKKLQRLLRIPIIGGLVRKKVLTALGLDQCHIAAGGAAPMPPDVLRWYRALGLDLIEVYGMTENCGVSHATEPGTSHPGSVGLPYDGVESRIDAVTGEIQMRSPGLMLGYYRDAAQTAESFTADGWLRTGDKGAVDADGLLRITGRVKDLFKTSKGKYVAPAPIEDLLVNHPDVEACVVTGANFAQPLALVMLSADAVARSGTGEGRQAQIDSLKLHLEAVNQQLEAHEKLACLMVMTTPWTPENGLVTPTMKIKRNRIEEAYGGLYESSMSQNKPVVWAG